MNILLISNNATIQKLFTLSAAKRGDEVAVGNLESIPDGEYDVVFIDKELFSDELFNNLKSTFLNAKFVLILNKNDEKIPGFDEFIIKPFLPTDLIELLNNLKDKPDEKEDDLGDFDLESFDDLEDSDLDLEEDFVVSDDELEKEVEENEEEEDFLISDEDLETEEEPMVEEESMMEEEPILEEDVVEEEALEEEVEQKENVDEDFVIEDLSDENEEESEIENENLESELDELDKELETIDEKALAEAIGEEVGEELEELEEKNESHEYKNTQSLEEKTLGNILNINWEELKKAKAKVTITIDFGG